MKGVKRIVAQHMDRQANTLLTDEELFDMPQDIGHALLNSVGTVPCEQCGEPAEMSEGGMCRRCQRGKPSPHKPRGFDRE